MSAWGISRMKRLAKPGGTRLQPRFACGVTLRWRRETRGSTWTLLGWLFSMQNAPECCRLDLASVKGYIAQRAPFVRQAHAGKKEKGPRSEPQTRILFGGPSGTRTPNQLIKSQLLYQLS